MEIGKLCGITADIGQLYLNAVRKQPTEGSARIVREHAANVLMDVYKLSRPAAESLLFLLETGG